MLKVGGVLMAALVLLGAPAASAAVVYQPESPVGMTSQASPESLGAAIRPGDMQSLGQTGAHIVVDRPEFPPNSPAPEAPEWALLLAGAGLGVLLLGAQYVHAKRAAPRP
jgi:hypothetical protein